MDVGARRAVHCVKSRFLPCLASRGVGRVWMLSCFCLFRVPFAFGCRSCMGSKGICLRHGVGLWSPIGSCHSSFCASKSRSCLGGVVYDFVFFLFKSLLNGELDTTTLWRTDSLKATNNNRFQADFTKKLSYSMDLKRIVCQLPPLLRFEVS